MFASVIVWTGLFCEEDLDGCEAFGCYPGATCSDNPAPESGATCECPQGFNEIEEMCDGQYIIIILK